MIGSTITLTYDGREFVPTNWTYVPPEPSILANFDQWFAFTLAKYENANLNRAYYGPSPLAGACAAWHRYASDRHDYEHMVDVLRYTLGAGADTIQSADRKHMVYVLLRPHGDTLGVALRDSVPVVIEHANGAS